jgi:basic amino acid/polyamine antiporter, APA family
MTDSSPAVPERALGFWMATALVIGNTIGMGIFLLPATLGKYGFNAVAGWVITLIGFLFIARTLSGLARAYPQEDGPYAYTQRAFGEGTAFMVMWCYWVSTWITNAAIAIGVVGYLSILVPAIGAVPWLPPVIALSLVWFFVAVNLRGVRLVGGTQILTTALKLLPMLAVVALGIWQLVTDPGAYVEHPPATPLNLRDVVLASTTAMFAMLGVECATVPASRVEDPERTIPRATMVGTTITALIYITICLVPMLLIPQDALAASNAPFSDLFERFLGGGSAEMLAMFVIVSGLGALNGWTLVVGEVTQNFAKHGSFPRALAKLNSRGAPARALVLTGAVASFMLVANYNATIGGVFEFLTIVVTAANLPMYFACALAVMVLWRRGELVRVSGRDRTLLWAGFFAAAFCLWAVTGVKPIELAWAGGLAAVGAVIYIWSLVVRRRAQAAAPAQG